MYDIAKKARAGMKSKAERLATPKLERVDSSDWTPAEPLNADKKTGMRPVSKQALKRGGKVHGMASKQRADRVQRKAGGRVETKGEQPLVDRYINRDLKKANEYRDGEKHVGGMKKGGRAKLQQGGQPPAKKPQINWSQAEEDYRPTSRDPNYKPDDLSEGSEQITRMIDAQRSRQEAQRKDGGRTGGKWIQKAIKHPGALHKQMGVPAGEKIPAKKLEKAAEKGGKLGKRARLAQTLRSMHADGGKVHPDVKEDKALVKSMVKPSALRDKSCYGGRTKKADGGPEGVQQYLKSQKEFSRKRDEDTRRSVEESKKKYPGMSSIQRAEQMVKDKFSPEYFENLNKSRVERIERFKRADGGPAQVDPRLGIVSPKAMNFAQNLVTPGLKKGGRAKKAVGGQMGAAPVMNPGGQAMPAQAMANAQGVPFQGGSFAPPGLAASAAGQAAIPNLAPVGVPSAPPVSGLPTVGSGLLPRQPLPPAPPTYDPSKYNPTTTTPTKGRDYRRYSKDQTSTSTSGGLGVYTPPSSDSIYGGMNSGVGSGTVSPMTRKNGGRIARADGSSTRSRFNEAFRAARAAYLAGEGPKNFEFEGKSYTTDLAAPTKSAVGAGPGSSRAGAPPMGAGPGSRSANVAPPVGAGPGSVSPKSTYTPPRVMGTGQGVSTMATPSVTTGSAPVSPLQRSIEGIGDFYGSTDPNMIYANGGRVARAKGGRTKGKTNVNIIIAAGHQPKSMIPGVPASPMAPQGAPPIGGIGAAPMGAGAPPMAPMLGGGAPAGGPQTPGVPRPPVPMMPPVGRKAGGRVSKVAHSFEDMTAGAGSGEGRLQKTDIAKRAPRKAGGKVYRSYKDMDAGAGSGTGRLEKTEIQSRKK